MPFTEFCCRNGGSNLNAGTRTGNSTEPGTSADFTYAAGNFVNSTGVFTVASGNPSSDGVAVGDFASIYNPMNALECYGGAASNSADCASTPDSAALSITGDIDIRAQISMEDWSPSAQQTVIAKLTATGNQRSWQLVVTTAGALSWTWSANGTATLSATSTANLSALLPNQVKWVRVTFDVDNGAGGNTATFYTSDDGSSWSALGSAVTTAGTTSIFDSTSVTTVGNCVGAAALIGKVYKAEIYNGIAGTRVANPDFTAQSAGATSFADGDGNTWTVNSPAAIVATTATNFVGRVTARDATTITVSTTAKAGPVPPDGTGVYTLKIGGAWKGPNAAEMFPFSFIANTCTNSAADPVRVNFKNAATYNITAALIHDNITSFYGINFWGYTSSYGDLGKATIDGGTSGTAYALLSIGAASLVFSDLIFQNNGASGNATALTFGARNLVQRVVVNSVRGIGMSQGSGAGVFIECEAYACNQSNTGSQGAFVSNQGAIFVRCIAHDNTGSSTVGFWMPNAVAVMIGCISDTNGSHGAVFGTAQRPVYIFNCDFYNNGGDGIRMSGTTDYYMLDVENCNFVKNGGYGINSTLAAIYMHGVVVNCGFGSGTQANTSGTTNGLGGVVESGTVTYAADVTPWKDPANGDFRITLPAAMNTGRGAFTETQASYSGTVGYPDIGAAQSRRGANRLAGWAGGLIA